MGIRLPEAIVAWISLPLMSVQNRPLYTGKPDLRKGRGERQKACVHKRISCIIQTEYTDENIDADTDYSILTTTPGLDKALI